MKYAYRHKYTHKHTETCSVYITHTKAMVTCCLKYMRQVNEAANITHTQTHVYTHTHMHTQHTHTHTHTHTVITKLTEAQMKPSIRSHVS